MRLGILAASALIGVVSLIPASFAQGDGHVMQERSRMPAATDSASASRAAPPAAARTLESARLPAGMLPEQPPGPTRSFVGSASNEPVTGGDIRRSLRRD